MTRRRRPLKRPDAEFSSYLCLQALPTSERLNWVGKEVRIRSGWKGLRNAEGVVTGYLKNQYFVTLTDGNLNPRTGRKIVKCAVSQTYSRDILKTREIQ